MTIDVPIKKSKAIRRFILFVLLLLICTLMTIQPGLFVKGNSFGFIKVTGIIGACIFIICAAFFAQKVFARRPGLTINNDGIIDNSLGVPFPRVHWSQITAIRHLQNGNDHFIAVLIKDPEKYIAAEPNTVKRKMLEMNYNTLKTPVNIAATRLKMEFETLFSLLQSKWSEFKNY